LVLGQDELQVDRKHAGGVFVWSSLNPDLLPYCIFIRRSRSQARERRDSVAGGVGSFWRHGTLSCFFLMSGMKKYREIVEIRTGERRARFVSFSLLIGVWYAAIVYFLLVYLPARPNLDSGRVR
jgi:hypothetical protein